MIAGGLFRKAWLNGSAAARPNPACSGLALLRRTQPALTREARSQSREGHVVLAAVIERNGSVSNAKVLYSSGSPAFAAASLDALRDKARHAATAARERRSTYDDFADAVQDLLNPVD